MAKRGALEHPKTLALADALEIMDCFALGILEAFWHHVGKYHEDGDITSLSPRVLCRSIRYTGDAAHLFAVLKECGFIDEKNGKLLVHDWADHADNAIHSRLFRALTPFADGTRPKPQNLGRDERATLEKAWEEAEKAPRNPATIPKDSREIPAGVPPGSLPEPEPEPVPVPEPKPGRGVGETKLRTILMEVPAFAKSPPAAGKLDEILEDFAELGDAAIIRHAKAARDWALEPKTRYARSPDKPADGVKFLRNWLEKEIRSGRNGAASESPPEAVKGWNPTEEELAEIHR